MDAARDHQVIVVTGQPGVGKTTLAINWGQRVRSDFPDGVIFADLHGYAPDGPARKAARSCGDVRGEAKMLNRLGLVVMGLGQPERAREYVGQALQIWRRLGDDYRIAGGQRRMGLVAMAKSDPGKVRPTPCWRSATSPCTPGTRGRRVSGIHPPGRSSSVPGRPERRRLTTGWAG
jgi:hypothetical protein